MVFQFLLSYVVLSLATSALIAHARPSFHTPAQAPNAIARRATVCNGHAELCNRSFGNVTFVGAHDSYAIGVNNREFFPSVQTAFQLIVPL